MNNISLKTIFLANSGGYSSKRVFGAIGFLSSIIIALICTVANTQAPNIVIDIIYASVALLGVDSVTSIWKTTHDIQQLSNYGTDRRFDKIEIETTE